MEGLTARFSLLDDMSDSISRIAQAGMSMSEQLEQAGAAVSATFDDIAGTVTTAAGTADGVATSISDLHEAAGNAASSVDELTETMSGYGNAAGEAAAQTDYWTDAAGNYDRSALEAIYTTEELVEMGLQSADALQEQGRMFELCERSAESLTRAMEATANIQDELSDAMEQASRVADSLADNENVSAETREELERASEAAAEATERLTAAQEEAEAAMRHYDSVLSSGTTDLNELETAAEQAQHAAENLAEANGRASEATEELARATENVTEETEQVEDSGTSAIEGISNALASAGIVVMVKEIATAVYEMAESFSEAENIVRVETGATGQELEKLMQSAQNVYADSSAESLEEIAAGMASIANATNITGEELEATTSKGYALQDLFGYDMAESAQTASALMKNFNITAAQAYDVIATGAQNGADRNGDLLDVLNEYSAQYAALGLSADEFISSLIEGADAGLFSVDKVGDAVKEFNIRAKDGSEASAEAFELLGMNAEIMTAKFAAGGVTASEAFFDVVAALESMEDPVQKNAAAVGLFGTMYEDLESTILPVLSNIEGGTIDTTDALSKMSENSQSISDSWQEAGNSIKTAFSSAISPTIEKVSGALAGIAKETGEFLNEHQTFTKIITAAGVGIGVLTAGITGFTFATNVAIPAVQTFGAAVYGALGPVGLVTAAIAGVVAAGTALATMLAEDTDVTEKMSVHTQKQADELEKLNADYERACNVYGRTSEQAGELALQISELEAEYESTGETFGEFAARIEETGAAIENVHQEFEDAVSSADELYNGSISLASQLLALSGQSDISGTTLETMSGIVDKLNASYEDLGLTIDKTTGRLNVSVPDLYNFISQAANEQKQQAAMDALTKGIVKFDEAKEELATASQDAADAWNTYESMEEQWKKDHPIKATIGAGVEMNWDADLGEAFDKWQTSSEYIKTANEEYENAIENIRTYCEQLGYSGEETDEFISQLESSAEAAANFSEQMDDTGEDTVSSAEAVSTAYEGVRDKIEELCTAYDEAYQVAMESFKGQFGLFDEASTSSEEYLNATIANAQSALDSQLAYWERYSADVETLKAVSADDLGVTQENYDALISYASDGSEQAAGFAHSMAEAVSSGNEEAVAALANTVGEIQEKQEEASAAVADWATSFSTELGSVEEGMQSVIESMDLSAEAEASAQATISSYVEKIRSGGGEAAESVAQELQAALSGGSIAPVNIKVGCELNTEQLDSYELPDLTADAEYHLISAEIDNYKMPDQTAEAEYLLNSAEVDGYIPENKEAEAVYSVNSYAVDSWAPPNKTATLTYNVQTAGSVQANANGTTNADSIFLAGENGPELVARPTAAYANGTTNSDDYFIAGENGPELIVGEQGSTVFPTSETDRLISALNTEEKPLQVQSHLGTSGGDSGAGIGEQVKRIFLEIAGSGAIEVGGNGGADKESILEIVTDHIKPILLNILEQEIYEEGDYSYEF